MFTIFYSWQSDSPNKTNRSLIERALVDACGQLKKSENPVVVEPVIDRDTQGVPGAPDIREAIFAKIKEADAFVADVSLVNHLPPRKADTEDPLDKEVVERQTPNPNVLTELGFALANLGHEAVILVANTWVGKPESLPFDLRQLRTITYNGDPNGNLTDVRKDLTSRFSKAINEIGSIVRNDPVYTIVHPRTLNVAGQSEAILRELIKHAGLPYDVEQITEEQLLDVCSRVDPKSSAPLLKATHEHANWMEYMMHYRQRSGKFVADVMMFSAFLKKEHVALLAAVEQSHFSVLIEQIYALPMNNKSLEWMSRTLWQYTLAARRLKEYANRVLAKRSSAF